MKRISTDMPNDNMRYHLQAKEWKLNELQDKMASQTRIRELRDDPLAAGHATRFQSKQARLERFSTNIASARGELALTEGNIRSAMDILQRVRELGVQGANGIYDRSQLAYMGEEVNQLLNEMVQLANARSGNGTYLFSGFRSQVEPFRIATSPVEGSSGEVITQVEYVGDNGSNQAEVSENAALEFKVPGNVAFWAENQQIFSTVEATGYRAQHNSTLRIDGATIELKEGDNVYAIISKINESGAPVKAKLDPVKNSLVLESTFAHQIWAQDVAGGRVLQDLGVVSPQSGPPPLNLADSARVFGGSIFDMILHLRDNLYRGDHETIGGSGLRGIDQGIETLTSTLAEIGSRDARLQITDRRLSEEATEYIRQNSEAVDLDLTQAVTELKMLEYTHQAALGTAGRILRPTLLDFLR